MSNRSRSRSPNNIVSRSDQTVINMANLFPAGFQIAMLSEIPTYDGNTSTLSEFIRACEVIISQFFIVEQPDAYCNKFLLSSIRNKLKGNALEVVAGYELQTWNDLKTTLINNFGDQRSELNLTVDLAKTRQYSKESPIEFYNRVRTLLATFNSKISLGNEDQAIKNYKLINTRKLALRSFLSGLNEPFGSLLRSRNPDSLENAIAIIRDEIDIRYSQNLHKNYSNVTIQNQNSNTNNPRYNLQNSHTAHPNNPMSNSKMPFPNYKNQFPHGQRNFFPNNAFASNQNPTMKLNSNTPPPRFPNQGPRFENRNVFAPQHGYRNNTPGEPMQLGSVIKRPFSAQTVNPNNFKKPNYSNSNQYIRQSNQPRNFHSEELFHHNDNPDPENFPPENFPEYLEYNVEDPYQTRYNDTPPEHEQLDPEYDYDNEAAGNFPN